MRLSLLPWLLLITIAPGMAAPAKDAPAARGPGPFAIPTFHCLGLYWSPPGGAADRPVTLRFRAQGTTAWQEGLPMRYHPIAGTEEDLTDYRGSLVDLRAGTTYEVELALTGTTTTARLTATTWSEQFPVGETVRIASRGEPLVITESGRPGAYRVYDGRGATIDVRHQHETCITVDATYVILRGFTLKGAGSHPRANNRFTGAIRLDGGHHIVIEDCDISDWGGLNPKTGFGFNMDSAILSRAAELSQLVVQRCRIHSPTCDGSNWSEPVYPTHSAGPQAISLFNTAGNHVLRYNECTSDLEHMYNDVIGGGSNGSFQGSPGPDSDIYGNVVSHCWDDGLEVEGGGRNVRVWGNYITQSMMGIANAATSIGPLYLFRNIVGRTQTKPDTPGGNFIKMGYAGSEDWMTGTQYIFHNTVFREGDWLPNGGFGGTRIVKHTVSRNNILQVRSPQGHSHSNHKANVDNSYDYDLFNGQVPAGTEAHGIRGEPIYEPGAGFDPATKTGRFQLAGGSPGVAAGEYLPNFSGVPPGTRPDIGAHPRGAAPMRFGLQAP
ncbi:MAG: right-handed parallel beta-helix repeat-containing protein [Verrucomicrobia bacterium]|nr:right-handed parallel beta-helix repeat-containing protein [Verrucomicrobiota bacterium]